jgi:hypothetical protein
VLRPAWLCAFVVPLGPVDVRCVSADGRELWQRAVDARGPREWLRP